MKIKRIFWGSLLYYQEAQKRELVEVTFAKKSNFRAVKTLLN
jgi:hypothetical protein